MLGFMAFVAAPTIASLVISFFDYALVGTPRFIGFANYSRLLFEDPLFMKVLGNTLYYVASYVVINVVIAIGLAVWLTARTGFASFFRAVFFVPVIIPTVAVALIFRLLYLPEIGLINVALSSLGLSSIRWLSDPTFAMPAIIIMSVWMGFGYNLVIFIAGLKGIPDSLTEAATIDGAGAWKTFWRIKLPLLSPYVFFATVMTVIFSFQVFDQTYIMTGGGPINSTNTLVLYMYQQGFEFFRMGYASAIAWVLFALVFVTTLIQSRMQGRWVTYDI
ncbi:MAG: sugar ABC transporter permease [Spirochaetaceae bacterium]|nr:MAG: sugar ABC transporter permease [Spirochaetaceae bacterium]